MDWRLIIETSPRSGEENMQEDQRLFREVLAGAPPTLRFYRWSPAAISLGRFQDPQKELDLEACQRLGVDWVSRPTGGRAVLHDHELTYCLVAPEDLLPDGILPAYQRISQGLLAGLSLLGVQAQMAQGQKKGPRSGACFDSPSWYEVTVGGRKLIGSAMLRQDGGVLQHGSLPFTLDPQKIYDCLNLSGDLRQRLARLFPSQAVGLADVLGGEPEFDQVAQALARGVGEVFGIALQ